MSDEVHKVEALIALFGKRVGTDEQVQPITRVDNTLIFQGGYAREMTRGERLKMFFHLPVKLPPPTLAEQDFQRRFREQQDRVFFFGER